MYSWYFCELKENCARVCSAAWHISNHREIWPGPDEYWTPCRLCAWHTNGLPTYRHSHPQNSILQGQQYFPWKSHYSDVIMSAMVSQITGVSIACLTVCIDADKRKQQSSASLAFVGGSHRWPAITPHRGPVTQKMFPFDDVIMRNVHGFMPNAPPLELVVLGIFHPIMFYTGFGDREFFV